MKKIALILLLIFTFTHCKSSKNKRAYTKREHTSTTTQRKSNDHVSTTSRLNEVVEYAKSFEGVRYKYGGTSTKGMDCSGLVYTAFKKEHINLPRTTKDLSTTGNWIDLKEVQVGDLLLFATRKNSRTINHVGIVTSARTGHVELIHASTSKGVIISNLAERYWYFAFVQARRVI